MGSSSGAKATSKKLFRPFNLFVVLLFLVALLFLFLWQHGRNQAAADRLFWKPLQLKELQQAGRKALHSIPPGKIVDWIFFNDEFDMLAYRLKAQADLVHVTVVVEADRTFSGLHKPRYLQQALTGEGGIQDAVEEDVVKQLRDHVVQGKLLLVPYPSDRANRFCKIPSRFVRGSQKFWVCEGDLRQFRMEMVLALFPADDDDDKEDSLLHYFSDVDEILDVNAVRQWIDFDDISPQGYRPNLELHYYNLRCRRANSDGWRNVHMFMATTGQVRRERLYEGNDSMVQAAPRMVGWHFSFFFASLEQVRRKNKSFSHSQDSWMKEHGNDSDEEYWDRVAHCQDLYLRENVQFDLVASPTDLFAVPPNLESLPQLQQKR